MQTITLTTGYATVWRDGRIVQKLNVPAGDHEFSEDASIVEYDSEEALNSVPYPPELTVTASSSTIVNDGEDSVTITVTINSEWDDQWAGEIVIDGTGFEQTFATTSAAEEQITTTQSAGSIIEVAAHGAGLWPDAVEIEVVNS